MICFQSLTQRSLSYDLCLQKTKGVWASMAQGVPIVTCFLLLCSPVAIAVTNDMDVTALTALKKGWMNTPSDWEGADPCGDQWDGIKCEKNRITSILLSSIDLVGKLADEIYALSELKQLDLSYNKGLEGPLPKSIGKLSKLTSLVLVGCSFSGVIPDEIGLLQSLVFLSLNTNNFNGSIPAAIGNLTNLYWLDLSDNFLSGMIPVSSRSLPGLDLLTRTRHFHLGQNQLTGEIPSQLFSSNMVPIHVVLNGNKLTGSIPSTLGFVKSLEILRLDGNSLEGTIPSNLGNLTLLNELKLANNKLSGSIPDLSGLQQLNYLVMDSSNLRGQLPQALLTLPQLQLLRMRNNQIDGTLHIPTNFSNQMLTLDLQNNSIDHFIGDDNRNRVILFGNPVCNESGATFRYCQVPQTSSPSYTTSKENCSSLTCSFNQKQSPKCRCSIPYSGILSFSLPSFEDYNHPAHYHILENYLTDAFKVNLTSVDSVALENLTFSANGFLNIGLEIFRVEGTFNRSEISKINLILSSQNFKPPIDFGVFSFAGYTYSPIDGEEKLRSKRSKRLMVGAAIVGGCIILIMFITIWLRRKQKKKAKWGVAKKNHFVKSWDQSIDIKEARCYSLNDLKASTDNFSEVCEIGRGGFGKVYRGVLPNGQLIAIKRSEQGSKQGRNEFNMEVELLSRVHHKNLVTLLGFCFENGEHTLVYDYISNGNLKDSLSGKSGIQLNWPTRVRIALGSASGLAYLHESADPPIIHRDIKSANILLDEHLNAKVSDFGLSKPIAQDDKIHYTTQVKGTIGYLDPKYYMTHHLSKMSDVYSFGVLLLEMITARAPIEQCMHIVAIVASKLDKEKDLYGLDELLDPVLGFTRRPPGFHRYVELAMSCVEDSADLRRPTMSMVAKELETIAQLVGVDMDPKTSRSDFAHIDPCNNNSPCTRSDSYLLSDIQPR